MGSRPLIQKHDYIRSREWLDWVKAQPSVVSGKTPCDPHHIKGYSWITGSGGKIKGDDLYAIPITRDEHREGDDTGWDTWEAKHGSQLEHWAKIVGRAIREGVLRFR